MHCPWTWIDQSESLTTACKVLAATGVIAVDTEYNSLHYFREKLCLIQIHGGHHTYLIDPLAGLDLTPLHDIFAHPEILKIFHAGDNDIRIIKRDYGFIFKNIFDTQKAAAILGHHFLSLENLIQAYLPVDFKKRKKTQRSRWEIRPLTDEQLHYASLDTVHLIPLYLALKEALNEKGLSETARKAFLGITEVTWREKTFNPFGYKKLPGYYNLPDHQKLRLKNLYRWRFHKAQEIDRAPFLILDDRLMMTLAQAEIDLTESNAIPDKSQCGAFCRYVNELIPILQAQPQA